ncbi:MAG: alpha/beta fold hydrolase [Bacteroidota bacterium]
MNNHSWLDRTAYPFKSQFFPHADGRIHYLDEGQGEAVVMVHGTPTWSFMYRHLISSLSAQYRVIAPDHLGFGLSDKPKQVDYSVQAQALRFESWLDSLALPSLHLVVHDFGGPIALAYALKYPHKIKSLTIANTWMWSARGEAQFEKMAKTLASPLLPFLYRWLNFSARFLIPQGFAQRKQLSRAVHRQYLAPFAFGEREAPLAFARSLLEAQDWFASLWEQRQNLKDIRTQILWGSQDRFLDTGYAERFASIWPEAARIIRFDKAGHFLWEEAHQEILPIITQFIK